MELSHGTTTFCFGLTKARALILQEQALCELASAQDDA
jgi:hypothetical protein